MSLKHTWHGETASSDPPLQSDADPADATSDGLDPAANGLLPPLALDDLRRVAPHRAALTPAPQTTERTGSPDQTTLDPNGPDHSRAHLGLAVASTTLVAAAPSATHTAPNAVSTATGVKTTQIALGADVAGALYGVSGAGAKIGIISDSFNATGGASADIAAGLLPSNVTIVTDAVSGTDEGRAMLELAYSIAPGATYYTADGGTLAQNVTALQNAGCNIIIDDLSVGGEALYQIGSATDIAIQAAVAAGVDYFTSAGNNGNDYYEQGFMPLTTSIAGIGSNIVVNQFGNGTAFQSLTFAIGATATIEFQWAQPFGSDGSGANYPTNSLAIYLLDANGNVVASSTANDVGPGNDPSIDLPFTNNTAGTAFRLVVVQNGGTVPSGQLFKYFLNDGIGTINDPNAGQGSGDLLGHELLPGINVVASASYVNTPAFGVSPTQIDAASSVGPGTILFDANGNPLSTPITVNDPQFAAPDGTTVGSANTKFASDPFFGTSAAAPAAGAVGALVLQADPTLSTTQVTSVLAQSVIPATAVAGFNGAGLIQARAAVEIATADGGDRWNTLAGGNWDTAANWSGGAAPTSAQAASLSDNLGSLSGNYTVTVFSSTDTAGSLAISAPAGSSVTLQIAPGGLLSIGGPSTNNRTAGDLLVSDHGTLNVAGGAITETGSLNVNNGTVTVSLGSITANNYAENAGQLTVGGDTGAAGLTLTGSGFTETGGTASIQALGTLSTTVIADAASTFAIAAGGVLIDTGAAAFTNNAVFMDSGSYTDTEATTFLNATVSDSGAFVAGSVGFSQSTFTETGSLQTTGALTFDDTGATIAAGATANVASLGVGATLVGFASTLTIAGKLTDSGGLSQGSSGTTGSVVLQTGGELDVGGANNQIGISFSGNGLLAYTSSNTTVLTNQEGGVITGLGVNNGAIDFTGLTYNTGDTLNYNASNGQVDVYDQNNNDVAEVFLDTRTNYTGLLKVQSDGPSTNHVEIVESVCYASGTRILTARGDVAVEELVVGDIVVTSSGVHRPIRWIGHRALDCRNHPRPEDAHPIRIARHAFGDNKPTQDLYVSPAHAICIDVLGEVLIPACALANGSTITQVPVEQITYWHVELDSHDILIANGLPAESYIDMGNRRFFVESDVVDFDVSPDADLSTRTHADFCRPFVLDGPILGAVRMQLRRRAETMGWTLDASHPFGDLHIVVDGIRVDPVMRGLTARFTIPAGADDAWLVSTAARPCDVTDSDDQRRLGVCLTKLTIDEGFGERRLIGLDHPLLEDGLYHLEDACRRWTSGRAHLPTAIWDDCAAEFFLLVEVAGPALPYWAKRLEPPAAARERAPAERVRSS